jgi:hypothetical protein
MGIDMADMALYLNITFFSVLVLGLLFGLIKGFRRSLYTFIITLVFLVVFFLTVNVFVEWFYTAEIGFLNNLINQFLPVSNATSVQNATHLFLSAQLEGTISLADTSPEALAIIDSIGMLVLKIVYTIIYFTVFQIIYRFILFIIGLFIFAKGRAKNKKGKRNRPLGAVFGTLTATLNLFVMIIILSGVMSIAESLSDLQATELAQRQTFEMNMQPEITDLDDSLERVGRLKYKEMSEQDQQIQEALDTVNGLVESYNNNIIIQALNSYQVEDEFTGEQKNAAIILFDEVLSMNYNEEPINLRSDLIVFVDVAKIYLNSDYYANGNESFSDIKSEEVGDIFTTLSKSKLLVSLIPVAIEVGVDYSEVDIEIDREMLYETIKWQDELEQIGVVATAGFMILEQANALDSETDIKTVSFSGELTKDLFDELSESELAKYGAFIAISQAITASQGSEMDLSKIIVVPETVEDWGSEFEAFGVIANEILSSGITINDFETKEPLDLIAMLSDADLTKLLNSSIVTNALINILSGQTDIDIDVEFLSIPDLTREEWLDQLSQDGEVLVAGELRNILTSLNILVQKLDQIDFDNVVISDLTILTDDEIDEMFNSIILVASLTEAVKTIDTGDFELIIPDSVLDNKGYILKEEVKTLFKSISLVASTTACDPDDDTCDDTGIDFSKALELNEADINKLFESEILFATTSNLLISFEEIVVPNDIKITIQVDNSPLTIVNKEEIKLAIFAISALGVTDVENIEFDESLLLNLSVDPDSQPTVLDETKTDKIFESKLLHATISDFLIKATEPEPGQDALIVVPYFASENYADTTSNVVLDVDTVGGVTYISANELTEILQAILLLELSDFNNIEASLDIASLLENTDELLDSAILHATISQQLVDQTSTSDDLVVPNKDSDNNDVFVTVGSGEQETRYISKAELNAIFSALELLDIDDINNVSLESIDINLIVDNDDALLASAILHATISYQIIKQTESGDLVVPSLDLNNDPVQLTVDSTDFISKTEITSTLEAIQTLGITSLTDVNVDASILQNLADDTDSSALDVTKAQSILGSKILHATISKLMIDYSEPDPITLERTLVVPYTAAKVYSSTDYTYNEDEVRFYTDDSDEYIVEAEIIELLRIVIALEIDDFESFNDSDPEDPLLGKIMPHKDILFNSAIIQATISDKILAQNNGDLTIPEEDIDENPVIITKVDELTGTHTDTYISEAELIATLDALEALDLTDFNNVSIDTITLSTIIDNDDLLLSSATIHATISKQIIDQSTDELLVLPYYDLSNDSIRVTVEGTEFITKAEIKNTFTALEELGIDSFSDVSIDASILQNLGVEGNETVLDDTAAANVLASKIVHATISKVIFDASQPDEITSAQDIIVPYTAETNYNNATYGYFEDEVRFFTTGDTDEYIVQAELIELFRIVLALDISDFNSFNDSDPEDPLLGKIMPHKDILFNSAIIQATISDKILEQNDGELTIPDKDIDDNFVIVTITDTLTGTHTDTYITELELIAALDAMEALGIDDFNNVSLDTITMTTIIDNDDLLLASAIIHATISKQIIDQSTDELLVLPYYDLNNDLIRETVAGTEFVTKDEIKNTFAALDELGIDSFSDVSIDASILKEMGTDADQTILDDTKAATVLASKIVHATISKVIFDASQPDEITSAQDIIVPYTAETNYNNATYGYFEDEVRFFTTGDTDEYIVQAEMVELFRVVLALDINDFNSFGDSNPEDPLLAKIMPHKNILFNSAIIQATISDKMLDQNDGELTIPDKDIDENFVIIDITDDLTGTHTDTYITEVELIAALDAMEALGIDDFNDVSLDTITMTIIVDNDDLLLASAIIHATISKQIIDQSTDELLVLPYYDLNNDLIRETVEGTEFVIKAEIKNTFAALQELGIESFSDVSIDASILKEMGTDADQTILDDTKAATVLASKIVHATISKVIFDASQPDEITSAQDIIVPYTAENNYNNAEYGYFEDEVRFFTTGDTDEYIVQAEMVELFRVVLALDINDFNSFGDSNPEDPLLARILPHKDILFNSAIIQATITDKIRAQDGENLIVPNKDYNEVDVVVTRTDALTSTHTDTYIIATELVNVLEALEALDITDFNDVQINDFTIIIDNSTTLLESAILHATISDKILQEGESDSLTIPTYDLEENLVRKTVDTVEFIKDTEIIATLDALKVLEILSFDDVEVTVSILQKLAVDPEATPKVLSEEKTAKLFESKIVHATLSKLIIDAGVADPITGDRDLIVPYLATESYQLIDIDYDNNNTVRTTILATDEYIVEAELTEMFEAILVLNIEEFADVANLTLTIIVEQKDQLLDSAILHATVSKQIFDLESTTDVVIPEVNELNNSIIVEDNTDLADITTYLIKEEIKFLLDAVALINSNPDDKISDISGTVELDVFLASQNAEYDANQDTLFDSSIMKATVSKQVFNLEITSSDIIVPDVNQAGNSIIIADNEGDGDAFLIKAELKALLNATDLVTNMNQISDFDGAVDLSNFFASQNAEYDDNQDILLSSSIMQATISLKITNLESSGKVDVPSVDILSTDIEKTYGTDYFIVKDEIKSMINVMDLVGFSNLEQFDGAFDFSVFSGDTNQTILLNSAIMHRTVSKQIIENNSLSIPYDGFDFTDDTTVYDVRLTVETNEYLIKDEIKNLLNVMNLITGGTGDLDEFNASIDIGLFASETNQDTLLKSAVMHYTVSDQIISNNGLVVPELSLESDNTTNLAVRNTAGTDEFIVRQEIKDLINVMNLVTTGSLDGFSGSFNLSVFAGSTMNDPGQTHTNQEMLLMSSIMHATISDQVLTLDANATLVAPNQDIDTNSIRITVNGTSINTEYLVQSEVANLIDGMVTLGLGNQSISDFDGGLNISNLSTSENQLTVLESATLHATFSDKLTGLSSDVLIVPNYTADGEGVPANQIRFTVSATEFIKKAEIQAILDRFISLGYGDLDNFPASINSSVFFDNISYFLDSASFHATISSKLISGASGSNLIIPDKTIDNNDFVKIVQTDVTYVKATEIEFLILAFDELSITNFDTGIDASVITSLNETKLNIIMDSGTMHLTIESFIQGNNLISIPDLAIDDLFGTTDILIRDEVIDFILATQIIANPGDDITNISFNFTAISSLSVGDRNIVLESMIVRNVITPDVESAVAIDPFYALDASDYMENNTSYFLTKQGIIDYINHLNP